MIELHRADRDSALLDKPSFGYPHELQAGKNSPTAELLDGNSERTVRTRNASGRASYRDHSNETPLYSEGRERTALGTLLKWVSIDQLETYKLNFEKSLLRMLSDYGN